MSDYGAHPTQYGNLSDGNLYAMYRESVYRSLSESQKLDLLQETVNRDAAARGEAGSPRVQFENMPSRTDGYAEKGVISVNRDLAVNGTRTATYQGKTLQHTINDYNIQSLVTVLHENVHCYQDQIIDGTIRNAECDTKSRNVLCINTALSIWSNPTVTCTGQKPALGSSQDNMGNLLA